MPLAAPNFGAAGAVLSIFSKNLLTLTFLNFNKTDHVPTQPTY